MRKIAIIGAGQAGLYLGISLVNAGYSVTVYSDRTTDAILNSKLPATATLFPDALQLEKNLGLNFWDEDFLGCQKYYNEICDSEGNINLIISAPLETPWKAIDLRLKSSVWMEEFKHRGGKLIIQKMTFKDLEECERNYDLVIVSVGKGSLSQLFERDEQKLKHHKPQRYFAAILTEFNSISSDTFHLINIAGVGEIFQFPFYNKDKNTVSAVVIEAYPNGLSDLFNNVKNPQELLGYIKRVIQKFAAWNYDKIKDSKAIDDLSWIRGEITPIVGNPVGHLKSGGIVMGIGDAVILNDPIAAQGANNAIKIADLISRRIIERGDRPFDELWMQKVFDEFWEYSQYVNLLSNFSLEPDDSIQSILKAMAENPEVARDIFNSFNHPPNLDPWYFYPEETRKYLNKKKSQLIAARKFYNLTITPSID